MRPRSLVLSLSLLATGLGGCVAARSVPEPPPDGGLDEAVEALAREEYREARDRLAWIYAHHWTEPVGQAAFLVLANSFLDPRIGPRRPDAAAELAARNLALQGAPAWARPVSEALYLMALELGARPPAGLASRPPPHAAPAPPDAQALPELPEPGMAERIATLTVERDRLADRAERLERDLMRTSQELARREQELERIRRTLKP